MKKVILCSVLLLLETPLFANGGIVCSPPKGGDGIVGPSVETE